MFNERNKSIPVIFRDRILLAPRLRLITVVSDEKKLSIVFLAAGEVNHQLVV